MKIGDVTLPEKGSTYRHHSGRLYVVTGWTNLKSLTETHAPARNAKFPPTISYSLQGEEANPFEQFSRPLWQFMETFEKIEPDAVPLA